MLIVMVESVLRSVPPLLALQRGEPGRALVNLAPTLPTRPALVRAAGVEVVDSHTNLIVVRA